MEVKAPNQNLYAHSPRRTQGVSANDLAAVSRTLAPRGWNLHDELDTKLGRAMRDLLLIVGADGVIMRNARRDVTMSCFLGDSIRDTGKRNSITSGVLSAIEKRASKLADGGFVQFEFAEDQIVCAISPPVDDLADSEDPRTNFCAFVVQKGNPGLAVDIVQGRVQEFLILAINFYQAARRRSREFGHFPGPISQAYWEHSGAGVPLADDKGLAPPWKVGRRVWTSTLSLDLRKSTFCMQGSEPQENFAFWLDELVQILTQVAHVNGGVFDKFTGDGALVHFLEEECKRVYAGRRPVTAAMKCAVDMQHALDYHYRRLRCFLTMNSAAFGGGIGISHSQASWSVDYKGNPIVVGMGVVHACRVGDDARAGEINLTNNAYHQLCADEDVPDTVRNSENLVEAKLNIKGVGDEMQLLVWKFKRSPAGIGNDASEIEDICEEVYSSSQQLNDKLNWRRGGFPWTCRGPRKADSQD